MTEYLSVEDTYESLENLLVRRGLKFPLWTRSIQLLSSTVGKGLLTNLAGNLVFWGVLFGWLYPKWSIVIDAIIVTLFDYAHVITTLIIYRLLRSVGDLRLLERIATPRLRSTRRLIRLMYSRIPVVYLLFLAPIFVLNVIFLQLGFYIADTITGSNLLDQFYNESSLLMSKALRPDSYFWFRFLLGSIMLLIALALYYRISASISLRSPILYIVYISSSLVSLGILGYAVMGWNHHAGSVLYLMALQAIFAMPIMLLISALVSGMTMALSILPGLIKIRANVLGLTFLAATIPFLNADSWQLVTGISWWNIAGVVAVIYLLPTSLFIYSHRQMIHHKLYSDEWVPEQQIDTIDLPNYYRSFGLPIGLAMESVIHQTHSQTRPNGWGDKARIFLKLVISILLILTILPFIVFVFGMLQFEALVSQQVLSQWIQGFQFPTTVTFWGLSIDGWTLLKIKAATLLAVLSAASSLGTLLSNNEDFSEFLEWAFVNEVRTDRRLLALHRTLKMMLGY